MKKPPNEEEVYTRVCDALSLFAQENKIPCETPAERSRAFEQFAVTVALVRHDVDGVERQAVLSRGGHDTQLDSVALIANGILVTSREDVAVALARAERTGELIVDIVLVQATLTRRLSTEKLTKFGYGVLNFMQRDDKLGENRKLRRLRAAKAALEDAAASFSGETRMTWTLYYVWAGVLRTAPASGYFELLPDAFKSLIPHDNLRIEPIYGLRALALWERARAPREATFDFPDALELPPGRGAEQAYLGVVRARELLKLVTSPEGDIIPGAFEENVRHFLGDDPPVNRAIAQTLQSDEGDQFVLRNNGVTIVAHKAERDAAGRTSLVDHQIVNGCQTTFVLFRMAETLDDSVLVPLKLVVTSDGAVKSAIVRGANSQTIVQDTDLMARRPFVRRLQNLFDESRIGRPGDVEFERRVGEKANVERSTPHSVVRIDPLIKAFAAVWLERPHAAHGHADRLRADVPDVVFNDEHEPMLYLTAAHLLIRAREVVGRERYPALYHLCFAARLFADGGDGVELIAGPVAERRARQVAALAADRRAGRRLMEHAKQAVTQAKRAMGVGRLTSNVVRLEGFTKQVRAHALQLRGDG